MPSVSAYHDALFRAREDAGILVGEINRRLIRAYARALIDIQRDFRTGAISAERAEGLSRAIRTRLARFGADVEGVLSAGMLQAAGIGVRGHIEGYGRSAFDGVAEEAIERMIIRRGMEGQSYAASLRTIISRNLQDVASDIDDYLESAVARGVDGRRAAKELAYLMAKNDPEVQRIVGREVTDAPAEALKRAKRLMSDAERIAIHESYSAYDEADKLASAKSPVVLAVRWRTSGRHGGLPSAPDVCDVVEQADIYGLGPGVYPPEFAPPLLHPRCTCSCEKHLRPVEDWGKPKPPLPSVRRALTREDAGGLLGRRVNQYSRSVTEKHIKRQYEIADELIKRSFQTGRKAAA